MLNLNVYLYLPRNFGAEEVKGWDTRIRVFREDNLPHFRIPLFACNRRDSVNIIMILTYPKLPHPQNKNGIIAFRPLGYFAPNSFLYALCFLRAQIPIWVEATARNTNAIAE